MKRLSDLFSVQSRFARSTNLERDGDSLAPIESYILTPKGVEVSRRVVSAFAQPNSSRAWTFTGVYGTGKSSFANFLSALFASADSDVGRAAHKLVEQKASSDVVEEVSTTIPEGGVVRCVVTARQESVARAVTRGLIRGARSYWAGRPGRRPKVVRRLLDLGEILDTGGELPDDFDPVTVASALASQGGGLLIIVDELGKLLEHSAHSSRAQDLYLLQELAELPSGDSAPPVLLIGLLHQAFSAYGHLLTQAEQAEWNKIQGRFEDVPFSEPMDQQLTILGRAIRCEPSSGDHVDLDRIGNMWSEAMADQDAGGFLSDLLPAERCVDLLPLNPVAAAVLPDLCARFGQNERSLFTFVASGEPNSLKTFLESRRLDPSGNIPMLGLPEVFDYFAGTARSSLGNRPHMSRWREIADVIEGARGLPNESLAALKAVGVMNLLSSGSTLRARRGLVALSLTQNPEDQDSVQSWDAVLSDLETRGLVTYRRQVDELRVWEGSSFNIDAALADQEAPSAGLASTLNKHAARGPVVAHRHSYVTGTLRYFVRAYADSHSIGAWLDRDLSGEGLLVHWCETDSPNPVPTETSAGYPVVSVVPDHLSAVESAANELDGLVRLKQSEAGLQADGVGRRELESRIAIARNVLDRALDEAFGEGTAKIVVEEADSVPDRLSGVLSTRLDETFHKGPILWNEIINRAKLTSQGSRAQRELIEAIIESPHRERLGIEGEGPDYSIYSSVLEASGIHTQREGRWSFGHPFKSPDTGVDVRLRPVWDAAERFITDATDAAVSLDLLYERLEAPPYGVREGLIPILLAALLVEHRDDVSVYQDGSFVPILTPAHFELLVKKPEAFSVRHFPLQGVELERYRQVLRSSGLVDGDGTRSRNSTLLGIVRPLIEFAVSLPDITKKASDLPDSARGVRDALLSAREPEALLFEQLPRACGFERLEVEGSNSTGRREFVAELTDAIRDLRTYYDRVIDECEDYLHRSFARSAEKDRLKSDLGTRASALAGRVVDPGLKRFVQAAAEIDRDREEWVASVSMVVTDKPVQSWSSQDRLGFPAALSKISQQFREFEALDEVVPAATAESGRLTANRVSVSTSEGTHTARVVWTNADERETVEALAVDLLHRIGRSLPGQTEAVVLRMLQLGMSNGSTQPNGNSDE